MKRKGRAVQLELGAARRLVAIVYSGDAADRVVFEAPASATTRTEIELQGRAVAMRCARFKARRWRAPGTLAPVDGRALWRVPVLAASDEGQG